MNSKKHPVYRTLGFAIALGLFSILWMSRAPHYALDLIPFPKWDDVNTRSHTGLNPAEIDTLMSIYAHYEQPENKLQSEVPDTVIVTIQPDSLVILSPAIDLKPTPSRAIDPVFELPDYRRNPASNSLHPNLQLQGSKVAFDRLAHLFNRLSKTLYQGPLHIFHFGDSQIEGDRITRTLRTAWQARWGGYGLGYLSPKPLVAPISIVQTTSAGWLRHARFGRQDTTIKHKRFGVLASFASFDEEIESEEGYWIRLQPNRAAREKEQRVNSIKILFGKTDSNARLSCFVNSSFLGTYDIKPDSTSSELTIPIAENNASAVFESIEFQFDGTVPEVDAIGLLPDSGLVFHNVAMRGSSGTLFRQLDRNQFSTQLQSHDVGMIILQFGGNAVPYIADTAAVKRYGQWFASQIRLFQVLVPNTAIIVVGPSDMAVKKGQNMVTYPMLIPVRNALREATLNENALYWDVFEVMGGEGSMAAWATSEPKLASSDHVHFTRRGAKKVASLLVQSLDAEWAAWQTRQRTLESTLHLP